MLAAYVETNQSSKAISLLGANSLLGSSHSNQECFSFIDSSNCAMDFCSFYEGPTDAAIMAFGESESCGSIAYTGDETCGSIAFSGVDAGACASVASTDCCSCSCSFSC